MTNAIKSIFEFRNNEISSLNGIRAFSIVAVLISHYVSDIHRFETKVISNSLFFFLESFFSGVDMFFILSGFLISAGLNSGWKKTKKIDYKNFFIKRSMRIYPAFYFFILLITLSYIIRIIIYKNFPLTDEISKKIFFFENQISLTIYDALYLSNFFDSAHTHFWSLALEEQFYLIFPFFAALFYFKLTPKLRLIVLIILYFTPLIFRIFFYTEQISSSLPLPIYYMLKGFKRNDSIILGILLMEIFFNHKNYFYKITEGKKGIILFLAGVFISFLGHFFYSGATNNKYFIFMFTIINIGYGLIFLSALRADSFFVKFLSLPLFTPVARISYGMYICHTQLLYYFLKTTSLFFYQKKELTSLYEVSLLFILYFLLTFFFSMMLYMFVEYPFLKWKDKITNRNIIK